MVAAVLIAGSEKAAAHRLGLSHSTVKHHLAACLRGQGRIYMCASAESTTTKLIVETPLAFI